MFRYESCCIEWKSKEDWTLGLERVLWGIDFLVIIFCHYIWYLSSKYDFHLDTKFDFCFNTKCVFHISTKSNFRLNSKSDFRLRPHLKHNVVRGAGALPVALNYGKRRNYVCKRPANIHKFAQCEIWGHLFALLKNLKQQQHKLPNWMLNIF